MMKQYLGKLLSAVMIVGVLPCLAEVKQPKLLPQLHGLEEVVR